MPRGEVMRNEQLYGRHYAPRLQLPLGREGWTAHRGPAAYAAYGSYPEASLLPRPADRTLADSHGNFFAPIDSDPWGPPSPPKPGLPGLPVGGGDRLQTQSAPTVQRTAQQPLAFSSADEFQSLNRDDVFGWLSAEALSEDDPFS